MCNEGDNQGKREEMIEDGEGSWDDANKSPRSRIEDRAGFPVSELYRNVALIKKRQLTSYGKVHLGAARRLGPNHVTAVIKK